MANYRFDQVDPASSTRAAGATLIQQVYESLREEILDGTLRPGDRLVRRTLSRRLGVSPMPVTEALWRLEIEGLVESQPLCGARVRALTLEHVRNDQELREAIDCQAVRMCSQHASAGDLARLAKTAQRIDRLMSEGDPGSKLGVQTHAEFHLGVAQSTGLSAFAEELQRVWFRRLMRLSWLKATQYKRVPADWHQQLVAALASRDPDRAEAKMREHVQFGHEDDQAALECFLAQSCKSGFPA